MKILKFIGGVTPVGWITGGVAAISLTLALRWGVKVIKAGFEAKYVAPAVLSATEPLKSIINGLQADTTQLNEALAWQVKENESYADSIIETREFYGNQVKDLQRVVKQVEDKRKAEMRRYEDQLSEVKKENGNLRTGVKTVTVTLQKKLFKNELDTVSVVSRWGF